MAKEDPEWGGFLQATFLSVLESADEGLVVFDADGRCRMIGRRAGEIFGLEPAAYVGRMRHEVLAAFAQACEEPDALLEVVSSDAARTGASAVVEVDVRRPRPRTPGQADDAAVRPDRSSSASWCGCHIRPRPAHATVGRPSAASPGTGVCSFWPGC